MRIASILFATVLLAACAMKNNSLINQEPMQVRNEHAGISFRTDRASKLAIDNTADDIKRRANGPVTISVDYNASSYDAQRVAQAQGTQLRAHLREQFVKQPIHVMLQPVDAAQEKLVRIEYNALSAKAPQDCGMIGEADPDQYAHESDSAYRFGCTHDRYLAQMIARPGDLLGNDSISPAESQRLGRSQELYRAGQPATPADTQGLSASNVYRP